MDGAILFIVSITATNFYTTRWSNVIVVVLNNYVHVEASDTGFFLSSFFTLRKLINTFIAFLNSNGEFLLFDLQLIDIDFSFFI